MVIGILSILGHYVLTLYDSSPKHFFIFVPFVSQAELELEPLLHVLTISSPVGVDLIVKDRVRDGQVIVAR